MPVRCICSTGSERSRSDAETPSIHVSRAWTIRARLEDLLHPKPSPAPRRRATPTARRTPRLGPTAAGETRPPHTMLSVPPRPANAGGNGTLDARVYNISGRWCRRSEKKVGVRLRPRRRRADPDGRRAPRGRNCKPREHRKIGNRTYHAGRWSRPLPPRSGCVGWPRPPRGRSCRATSPSEMATC